jgi:hypothetical protein
MTDGLSTLYQDLLGGSYDCVDRIVLNAYFRMGHDPGGLPKPIIAGFGCLPPSLDYPGLRSVGMTEGGPKRNLGTEIWRLPKRRGRFARSV